MRRTNGGNAITDDLFELFLNILKVSLQRHNHKSQQKTEPTYTKTSLFLCEKRRFFMAWFWKGVVLISN